MDEEKTFPSGAVLVYLIREVQILGAIKPIKQVLLPIKANKIGAGRRNGYGGGIEKDETKEEAAVRELLEECEIIASTKDLNRVAIMNFHNTNTNGATFTCKVHVFLLLSWLGTIRETRAMLQPKWFNTKWLPFYQMMPADEEWLPLVFSGKKIVGTAHYGPFQKSFLNRRR